LGTNHEIDVLGGTEILRDNFRGFFASQSGFLSTDVDVRFINSAVADPGSRDINTFGSFGTVLGRWLHFLEKSITVLPKNIY